MNDKKTVIGDEMIENRLKEKSRKLGISLDELIVRYIKRGLYKDKFYDQCNLSKEKLAKIFKLEEKSEIPQKDSSNHNPIDSLVDIYIYDDEWEGISHDFFRYKLLCGINEP